jgi:hypothetical protein
VGAEGCQNSDSAYSCGEPVLVDQPCEAVAAFESAGDWTLGWVGRVESECAVGTLRVVMLDVLAKDAVEVPFVVDQ